VTMAHVIYPSVTMAHVIYPSVTMAHVIYPSVTMAHVIWPRTHLGPGSIPGIPQSVIVKSQSIR